MGELVYAVVLNWNNAEDTLQCVKHLLDSEGVEVLPVIVDNGSEESSLAQIEACPDINRCKLIRVGFNSGFSYANNIGLAWALRQGAKYVLLINNDTEVHAECLRELVKTMEEGAGISGGLVFYFHDRTRVWHGGGRARRFLPGGQSFRRRPPDDKPFDASFVTGAMMMISRDTLVRCGLLDETFFFGLEDYEYCVRAARAGVRIKVNPRAVMYHKVGTSRRPDVAMLFLMLASIRCYFDRRDGRRKGRAMWGIYKLYACTVFPTRVLKLYGIAGMNRARMAKILRFIDEKFSLDRKISVDLIDEFREWWATCG